MTPPNNSAALQVQIDSLGAQVKQGFDEIKDLLRSYEERTRAIETREAGCQPLIQGRIDAVWRRVDEHDTKLATKSQQINELEKKIDKQNEQIGKLGDLISKLVPMYKVFVFISSALGTAVIALIISLITGQAQITVK